MNIEKTTDGKIKPQKIHYLILYGILGAAALGTDKELHPTAAGLLMFGYEYRIIREFPEYFLDYREILDPTIRWTDRFYSSTGE